MITFVQSPRLSETSIDKMQTIRDLEFVNVATIELPFRMPFDWPRLLRFFGGRLITGVESVEDGAYMRAIEWEGDTGTLAVRLHPTRRCLVARVEGNVSRHAKALAVPLSRMFDLHVNPKAVAKFFSADPLIGPLMGAVPGLRVPGTWSAFELAVRTIVGQQVSVKGATTIVGRLVERAGERIADHAHSATAWRFPTPEALAAADLAKIGMPGKRIAGLQGFAHAVAVGDIPVDEPDADPRALRAALLALPGVGPWTVEYIAMRAWRDADAWPGTDLVLMQALASHDPLLQRPIWQRAIAETWRPWRAYAAMHLWNAVADRAGIARGG